jgi:hypothetical protein
MIGLTDAEDEDIQHPIHRPAKRLLELVLKK